MFYAGGAFDCGWAACVVLMYVAVSIHAPSGSFFCAALEEDVIVVVCITPQNFDVSWIFNITPTTTTPSFPPETKSTTGHGGSPGPSSPREGAHAARKIHAQEPEPPEVRGVLLRELPKQVPRQGRLGLQVHG